MKPENTPKAASEEEPEEHYNPIARYAVSNRVTMTMVVLGILVLGVISVKRLPLEYLPSFSSSSISVRVPYNSSSPDEVERLIVRPLEDALGTINGIDTLSASASSDSGDVSITFLDGLDMDMAMVDVRDRVDRVRHLLPDDVEQVRIRRFQSSDIPVISAQLSAEWDEEKLYDFTETVIQRRLERLPGVAAVSVRGLRTPELQIRMDPQRMEAAGLDVRDLNSALRGANVNVSAGELREGNRKLLVRAVGEFRSLDEIRRLPVGNGKMRLSDVAEVVYTYPRQDDFSFLNGKSALSLSVNKASTANLLAVVDVVKAELAEIAATPEAEGFQYRVYRDSSIDVRKGLGQLQQAGYVGGTLAIFAVFLFLRRKRTTALIAVAIPISVVFTFVIMYFLRQAGLIDTTLNVVSLMGLILALGMLVDNSIVVIESIFRHKNDLGEDARTATLRGTTEVAMPIIASTATTLCVFIPLIFMASSMGGFMRFMTDVGITISIVSVAALLVALTVVPMVAAQVLQTQQPKPTPFFDKLVDVYGRTIHFTLHHRVFFFILAAGLLAGSIYLLSSIERTFGARSVERQVTINLDTPRQYSLEQTAALYDEVYGILDGRREELGIKDISYAYDRGSGRARGGWGRGRRMEIYLVDEEVNSLPTLEVQNRIRALMPEKAGVEMKIDQARGHGGGMSGVTVELMGDDQSVLRLLAEQLSQRLAYLPMIRDVDTSLEDGDQEIHVTVNRDRALHSGLSTQAVAFTINNALSGRAASHFKTEAREIDMVVQYPEDERETLDQLKKVPVFAATAFADRVSLPLSAMASFSYVPGPRSINRENRQSKVTITANTTDPKMGFAAMGAVRGMMSEFAVPPGYSWSFGRWTKWQAQDGAGSVFALVFGIALIYMLMAALFESFVHPFTIMFAVPFAFIGVGIVMKLANQQLSNTAYIGLIILVGVVVNNAIVLVDHINRLRGQGLKMEDAIVRGGQHRLRPIMITAVTTILGMMPMIAPFFLPSIFGSAEGRAAEWAPVGLVIVGGLTTSTFLTVLIIPTIYSVVEDVTSFFKRVARAV